MSQILGTNAKNVLVKAMWKITSGGLLVFSIDVEQNISTLFVI